MAKSIALIVCFLAIATIGNCEQFDVNGKVYCDQCRLGFENSLQQALQGATVELTCTNIETAAVTFTKQVTTGADGTYTITVDGDHQEDVCQVKAISSGSQTCTVPIPTTARIECTENSGMHTATRHANALGFMNETPIAGCKKVLEELEFDDTEIAGLDFLSADQVAQLA